MGVIMHTNPEPAAREWVSAELPRLLYILCALAGVGWTHYVERLRIGRDVFETSVEAVQATDQGAERLRATLEGLRPASVKFGQLLSLRRDMLPEVYTEELQRLQDDVAIFPGEQTYEIVERELGKSVHALFTSFDETSPVAVSIGQVRTAQLIDGTSVVAKVQCPGIEPIIHADIRIMRSLVHQLERYVSESRRFGPGDLVEEFVRLINEGLDYQVEARNDDLLRENLQDDKHVFVPRIFWKQTSQRVLTMERSFGKKPTYIPPPEQESRRCVTQAPMVSFLKQVLEGGFFHGDPHPGNVLLLGDGRLCFHDFGITGRLSAYDQETLTQLILAISSGEVLWMVDACFETGVAIEGVDREAFTRDTSQVLDAYYEAVGKGYSFGGIVRQFALPSQRHWVELPRQFLLVSKAFMLVESRALTPAPDLNALASLREYTPHLFGRKLLQGANVRTESSRRFRILCALHHAAALLPDILNCTVEVFSNGRATLHIEHDQLQGLEAHIDHANSRLSSSLITASAVIGSPIIMAFRNGPYHAGIPVLGLLGFVVASVMGLAWAVAILRSGKFQRRHYRQWGLESNDAALR